MRLICFGALLAGLLTATQAHAAPDCTQSSLATTTNGETVTFDNGLISNSGETGSCSVSTSIFVPAGHYGVFRADSRGYVFLAAGDHTELSLTQGGTVGSRGFDGEFDDSVFFTKYYAVGYVATDTVFSGDAAVDSLAASDAASTGQYDSVDFLVGYTTLTSQQNSLDEIGLQQLGITTHLDATAGLLTGANQPLEGENEIGLLGGVGSYTLGITSRYNLAEGFSLLGGASIVNFGIPGASANGVLAAGALRFVQPGASAFRYFGEAGVQLASLGLSFSRHYDNGTTSNYAAGATGDGLLGSIYVRGGALWAPNADNDVVFSATLKQGALGIGSMVEDDPSDRPNLFSADYSGTTASFTTLKGGVDWKAELTQELDLTASLALGTAFANYGAKADIFGVGNVTGAPASTLFAEYGVRLGWIPTPTGRIDTFFTGSTGTGIGTHAQIGAAYHLNF